MRRHLVLKAIGTTLIIGIFFVAYLHLLHHPRYPVTVMPSTGVDRLVPFQPEALYVYLTLWLYVGAGPGLQLRWRELISYAAWSVLLCVAGLTIFRFWPTQIPWSGLDLSAHFGFAMLRGIDAAGNACPSMHVAFASFTAVRIDQVLRATGSPRLLRAANLGWATAIVYSTLAIRQHVVADVGAGLLLGTLFALASLRWGLALPRLHATAIAASAIAARPSDA
jgi:hypothetical protein